MAMIIMKIMKLFFIAGNIFLTSLCMISLFSCHSGKQGCGRYLSKTQRISNNIKIVLHPSLQAAISFSCCFLYHWKFLSNIFFDNIFCAIDKRFQFIFSFLVVNCCAHTIGQATISKKNILKKGRLWEMMVVLKIHLYNAIRHIAHFRWTWVSFLSLRALIRDNNRIYGVFLKALNQLWEEGKTGDIW